MIHTTPEHDAAGGLAMRARLNLTDHERNVLAADIHGIADAERSTCVVAAVTLSRRIGGPQNLRAYLDCLLAQS
jgi:hypothetical protein